MNNIPNRNNVAVAFAAGDPLAQSNEDGKKQNAYVVISPENSSKKKKRKPFEEKMDLATSTTEQDNRIYEEQRKKPSLFLNDDYTLSTFIAYKTNNESGCDVDAVRVGILNKAAAEKVSDNNEHALCCLLSF